MIQRFYESIIKQVCDGIGEKEHNICIAKYRNDFSVSELELPEEITAAPSIYYADYQFKKSRITGAFCPFLDIIKELFSKYSNGETADSFFERCHVYELHKSLFSSYFETGTAVRSEQLILGETENEQKKLIKEILTMLIEVSKMQPFLLVINRFQLAGKNTIELITELLRAEETANIGIVLGVNELQGRPEHLLSVWEVMEEQLEDNNGVFQIGNARTGEAVSKKQEDSYKLLREDISALNNLAGFMNFEQAAYYLRRLERRIKFENLTITDDEKFQLWSTYTYVSIYSLDLAKALELCQEMKQLQLKEYRKLAAFYADYATAMAYMYQGKLTEAIQAARISRQTAEQYGEADWSFAAELLEVQAKMSGWSNIFFCAQNVAIKDSLIENLLKYNYKNHLAYIYIYAYDNRPEMVAKAYKSEEQLIYFSKGIQIAKALGNEQLVYNAYQKNIMLASTNGMHEISTLYWVRTFEALSDKKSLEVGRVFCGLGYNLCARGRYEDAEMYMHKANQIFYELNLPEDMAEVYYNLSLTCIAREMFKEANDYLMLCIKIVEKLNLNSLRVCNLSKLYGLLALCNQKTDNYFNCLQYLNNCKQFLNHVIEKEHGDNDIGIIHDYAKCDDDLFLYYYTRALLDEQEGHKSAAFADFSIAESHLLRAEGNQFYCYRIFHQSRIDFYRRTGRHELMVAEQLVLNQYLAGNGRTASEDSLKVLEVLEAYLDKNPVHIISHRKFEILLRQEGLRRAYQTKKHQMEFISTWQRMLDTTDASAEQLLDTVMRTFLYHFTVDKAVFIQYKEDTRVLYNNTRIDFSDEMLKTLSEIFEQNQKGFAVSKISNNYTEHLDVVSMFGEDDVCSMVAIPFFNNGKVESIVITYVRMKDNWHSSVNRYMLDEDDLNIYELLFREVVNALNRLSAYEQIYEMNTMLYESAITDQLTGINNRKGFYQNISKVLDKIKRGEMEHRFGLMFIDLDNFKGYNDTFGHDIGDLILKSMADIFVRVCGDYGMVSRYGGDEFIIFLYTDDRSIIENIAKQIYVEIKATDGFRKEIALETGEQIEIEDGRKISCSIGIITSGNVESDEDINEMVKQADDLLYAVKTSTKGTYTFMR